MMVKSCLHQCASSQLSAARASTCSGTESDSAGMRRFSITLLDHRQRLLDLVLRHFEHQFVVHLQQHLRVELLLRQRLVHADHGAADDVGGGALQPRIDRGALVEGADRGVRGADVGIVAFAAEQRHHIAVLFRERLGLLHVVADAGEALEIFLDVGAGLLARDAELVGEAEGGDAVDDAEVDRLGAAAHFGRHVLDRHAEHFRRRHGVNVEAVAERLAQRRCRRSRRAAAARSANSRRRRACGRGSAMKARRILRPSSVRIGMFCRFGSDDDSRPVGGRGERVAGVHAMRRRIDVAGQRVGIGRFQLRHLPPVENLLRQFVALLGEFVEHARAGRPLPGLGLGAARQPHLAEQDVAELLRAAGIDGSPASLRISASRPAASCANSPDSRDSTCRSIEMPRRSMRASTRSSGRSSVS